jgi:hypothetical protein
MTTKLFFFALFAVLMTACSNTVDLAIDNPTSEVISCHVDSLYVEVPPQEVVWVEMNKGDHTITLANDSAINMNFTESVYMVNPSLSQYLMYEEVYGDMPYNSSLPMQNIDFLGFELDGNYAVIENVVNKVLWDYGPREALPEMLDIEAGDRPTVLKLMDIGEFIAQVTQSEEG